MNRLLENQSVPALRYIIAALLIVGYVAFYEYALSDLVIARSPHLSEYLGRYQDIYQMIGRYGVGSALIWERYEPLYLIINGTLYALGAEFPLLLFIVRVSILYSMFSVAYITSRGYLISLAMVVVFSISPMYEGLTFNLIRQGLAISFILGSLSSYYSGSKKIGLSFLALSVLTHYSSVFVAIGILLSYFGSRIIGKKIVYIHVLAVFLYISNLTLVISSILPYHIAGDRVAAYADLSIGARYEVGFKFGFLVLSSLGWMSIWLRQRIQRKHLSELDYLYMMLTSMYMMLSGMYYYDRFALYSWVLIPVLVTLLLSSIIRATKRGIDSANSVNAINGR